MITFDDHPAREVVNGEQVPAVPDQRMIRVNGIHAGYCGIEPGRPVCMVRRYRAEIMQKVIEAVSAVYGKPGKVSMPPNLEDREIWE